MDEVKRKRTYPAEDEEMPRKKRPSPNPSASSGKRKRKKNRRRLKKKYRNMFIIILVSLAVIGLGLGGYFYFKDLQNNTASKFETFVAPDSESEPTEILLATPAAEKVALAEEETTPEPTTPPPSGEYEQLKSQADASIMKGILNILLVGIDYAEERESKEWLDAGGSTAEHADVMIVLAVNFDKQTVDMISLPRDTYTSIPNVKGIYKLNASLDCGGGLFKKDEEGNLLKDAGGKYIFNESGLDKVCESCAWVISGNGNVKIPIQYYYAVTMPAVKELVNAVGGVDFDLDISFKMQGRSYEKGRQHMDGQAVLDYLRVRKSASIEGASEDDIGDDSRVNRQKDMLVAILNQLKSDGLLLKIPSILSSFSGQLFTNCNVAQTASLALYAYDMPPENIRMHSMVGVWGETKKCANQHFYFLDQDKRVELVKQVYNVDVPKELEYTRDYGYYHWADLQAERYLSTTHPLIKASNHGGFHTAYKRVQALRATCAKNAERYLQGEGGYLGPATEELSKALENLKDQAESAKSSSGYGKRLDFYSTLERYNEIQVDPS